MHNCAPFSTGPVRTQSSTKVEPLAWNDSKGMGWRGRVQYLKKWKKKQLDFDKKPTFLSFHVTGNCMLTWISLCEGSEDRYFPRYEYFSSQNFGPVQTDRLTDRQTDRQTESDAYEPIVQIAQVGSKNRENTENAENTENTENTDRKYEKHRLYGK